MKCQGKNCKTPVRFEIIYNTGIDKQTLTLCKEHYDSDPVFKLNIKTIKEVNSK